MAICIKCRQTDSLVIFGCLKMAPDNRSDEITLQFIACTTCQFRAIQRIELSARGADDQASVDSFGYICEPLQFESVLDLYIQCPDPENEQCGCRTHTRSVLNYRDEQGKYAALAALDITGGYELAELGAFHSEQFWYIFREPVRWQSTGDVLKPFRSTVRNKQCELLCASFPDAVPYVLTINEKETVSFTEVPTAWTFE